MWPALATVAVLLFAAAPAQGYPYPKGGGDVGPTADPSLLIKPAANGLYEWYAYSTFNQTRLSVNRHDFVRAQAAISPKPTWWTDYNKPNGNPWAPDVVFLGGKYWMYYSVSMPMKQHSAIGMATSPDGKPGTWTDQGAILTTAEGDPDSAPNALDPSVLVDYSGNRWLVFGSYFGGIYITRLDNATGRVVQPVTVTNIAKAGAIEGANMVKHAGAYYLFASYGDCCNGHQSSYHVKVGRSTSPTGPFVDRDGGSMLSGAGTLVLREHDWVVGPGGQSVVDDPADQREKLVYHYVDRRLPDDDAGETTVGEVRRIGFNDLGWDAGGWPYVAPRTGDVEVAELERGSEPGPGSGEVIDGWHVFAPGWVDRRFTVTDDSPYVVAVSARGRKGAGVWPIMRVWLDGQVLAERTIDSADWRLYRFDVGRLAPVQHRLRFELVNDYFGGNLEDDRNIYIDKLTASSVVDAETMELRRGHGEPHDGGWILWSNGKIENPFNFSATGRYVIRVRAKGSFAGGAWPVMRILVDGVEVANATVSSSAWTDYDLEVPAAASVRQVAVQYTNEYYGGTFATDRNLWIDTVSAAAVPAKCLFEGPTRPAGRNQDRC
ncbi:MAG: family 43 glycosylhydrolase [Actinomycetota bacterium]|nr:family 43 glycosylhydrolase [Actinomycetota bacterium]